MELVEGSQKKLFEESEEDPEKSRKKFFKPRATEGFPEKSQKKIRSNYRGKFSKISEELA